MDLLIKYTEAWITGLAKTAWLAGMSILIGIPLGLVIGWMSSRFPRCLGWPVGFLAFILGGTPVLIILLWLHYPLQSLIGLNIEPDITALFTLALVLTFSLGQSVRVALYSFPTELLTAGRVAGLSEWRIFQKISQPLLLRQLTPGILTLLVLTIHGTLFASLISVDELLRTTQRINATEYRPVELYTILGGIFWILCLPLQLLAKIMSQKSRKLFSMT